MFIFPSSGLGCDLEFGFSSFELENPLIFIYNKNFRPSGDCQAARSLSDCCGRSKQTASAWRAEPLQHTHVQCTCTEPPSRLLPLLPLRTVHTFQQPIGWRVYSPTSLPRDGSSAPRAVGTAIFSLSLTERVGEQPCCGRREAACAPQSLLESTSVQTCVRCTPLNKASLLLTLC